MSYFDTVAGQDCMESIQDSMQRIAESLEKRETTSMRVEPCYQYVRMTQKRWETISKVIDGDKPADFPEKNTDAYVLHVVFRDGAKLYVWLVQSGNKWRPAWTLKNEEGDEIPSGLVILEDGTGIRVFTESGQSYIVTIIFTERKLPHFWEAVDDQGRCLQCSLCGAYISEAEDEAAAAQGLENSEFAKNIGATDCPGYFTINAAKLSDWERNRLSEFIKKVNSAK